MRCKSCGKRMTITQVGLAGVIAKPNCICGKIRHRERTIGCEKCNAHGAEIQIKKTGFWYTLTCRCGHVWRVLK